MTKSKPTTNQPPSETIKHDIYRLYETIIDSTLDEIKKRHLMTYIFAWEEWSWRIIGISHEALLLFAENDFGRVKGTERGHIVPRADTYKKMLAKKLSFDEWWKLFWDNDKTILMTKEENRRKKVSKVYDIDWRLGYFKCTKSVSYVYTKKHEGEFLRQLYERI